MASMKQKTRTRWSMTSLLLLTMSILTALSCLLVWVLSVPDVRYLILLDAGSVHTSVYTYRYYSTGPGHEEVTETNFCDIGLTGISAFKQNPEEAAAFVQDPCLTDSISKIPEAYLANTSLELCATAGMRVMHLADPDVAQQILTSLDKALSSLGGGVMQTRVRILSGLEEALSGWVTAIQLSGGVVGALDWGGASAQITFPVIESEDTNIQWIKVAGENYTVHSQSNLCYGQAEAGNRHRAALVYNWLRQDPGVATNMTSVRLRDPCLPGEAVSSELPLSHIFGSPCTQVLDEIMKTFIESSNLTVSFHSDEPSYQECSDMVSQQFVPSVCDRTWQSMEGEFKCLDPTLIPVPRSELTYLAMSTYFYLTRGLNLTAPFTLETFRKKSEDICSLSLSELKSLDNNAHSACFQSVLMDKLLTTGYHFDSDSWNQIKFVKRIEGAEVGWGLGHALIQASSLGMAGYQLIGFPGLVVLLVLGGLLLVLSLLAALRGKYGSEKYSSLREL